MLKVHHLAASRGHRILWLLEELGLAYELVRYERDPRTLFAPPELRAIHPLGKSPVLEDRGMMLAESGAIIEYLLETRDDNVLSPSKGTPRRADYLYWMHSAEGSAMTALLLGLYAGRLGEAAAPVRPRIDQLIADELSLIEATLGARDHFAGPFSAADIQMIYPVAVALRPPGAAEKFPAMAAWYARMEQRPAYRRALERGGPVMP